MIDGVVFLFSFGVAAIVGLLVLSYLVSNNKLKPPFKQPAKVIVTTGSVALFLLIGGMVVVVVFQAEYEAADKNGWFSHDRKVSVWMHNDWLVGEFKSYAMGWRGERDSDALWRLRQCDLARNERGVPWFDGRSQSQEAKQLDVPTERSIHRLQGGVNEERRNRVVSFERCHSPTNYDLDWAILWKQPWARQYLYCN